MLRWVICLLFCFLIPAPEAAGQDLAAEMDGAIKLMRDSGNDDPAIISAMLSSSAQGYLMRKDYRTAMARVAESLQLARKANIMSETQTQLALAGNILSRSKDDDANKKFLLMLLQEAGDDVAFKKLLLNTLGNKAMYSGDLVFSMIVQQERADMVAKDAPGSLEEARALLDFGQVCVLGRLFGAAGPALRRAEALAIKHDDWVTASSANYQLGSALFREGAYKDAATFYAKQLSQVKRTPEKVGLVTAAISLADALVCQGEIRQAREMLEASYGETEDAMTKGTITSRLALLTLFSEDQKAKQEDQKAYFRNQLPEAIQRCEQAIKQKSEALPAVARGYAPLVNLGDQLLHASLCLLNNELDRAEKSILLAQQGLEGMKRSFAQAARAGAVSNDMANIGIGYYQSAIVDVRQQILVRQKKFKEALLTAELGRGQAQQRILEDRLGMRGKQLPPLKFEDVLETAKRLDRTLLFYSLAHAFDGTVRAVIPAKHPLRAPVALHIWLVRPDGQVSFRARPVNGSIDALIQKARQQINPPRTQPKKPAQTGKAASPADATGEKGNEEQERSGEQIAPQEDATKVPEKDYLHELYQVLIQPVRSQLPKDIRSHVTIIPQGPLFNVPFAALADDDSEPLIAKHTLSISPSIAMLKLAVAKKKANQSRELKGILLVGNPAMPSKQIRPDKPASKLSPLPGAEKEVNILADVLKAKPLVGKDATETKVVEQMKSAKLIHLATHGALEADNVFAQAYLSAVALAPDEQEDGFLTVRETMKLELGADLVVLSACNTGLGKVTGDGIVGLTRGYISAGVPTVVASLWPVSDLSAGYFMVIFHSARSSGKDDATALRLAALQTRKRFPKPSDWAAFSIYGLAL